MPFDHLLFFAEHGNGDLYFFAITRAGTIKGLEDVYIWDHETDSRTWWANGMKGYLERELNDTDGEEIEP